MADKCSYLREKYNTKQCNIIHPTNLEAVVRLCEIKEQRILDTESQASSSYSFTPCTW